MFQQKLVDIQTLLTDQKIDMLMIGNFGHQIADELLYYLLLETLECGIMLIPQHGSPTLFAISFEIPALQKQFPEIRILPFDKKPTDLLSDILQKTDALGIRPSALPAHVFQNITQAFPNTKIKTLTQEEQCMAIKKGKEITRMEQAGKLTDALFQDLLLAWPSFYTEMDAANFLRREMADRGIEPSFPPIVASGTNAANPHHKPTFKKIQSGFCVIDFGVRFKGYCSDMTRTIFVGIPSDEERVLYQTLLDTQNASIAMVRPGTNGADIDRFCRASLGEELNTQFVHTLGHGLGTQVHEWPRISQNQEVFLAEGMVITIEPGIYKKGSYGIRIEDDILVCRDGYELLTQSVKALVCV